MKETIIDELIKRFDEPYVLYTLSKRRDKTENREAPSKRRTIRVKMINIVC